MADFLAAFNRTLILEGGFADRPSDRGGMTFMGIARKHHPDWTGWRMVDVALERGSDPDKLMGDPIVARRVKVFYRAEFWSALNLDSIEDQAVADELFDSAVNCGPARAVRWLQQAMNLLAIKPILRVDGMLGIQTAAKTNVRIRNYGNRDLLLILNGKQFRHYDELVERDPTQIVNLRSWLRRVRMEAAQ